MAIARLKRYLPDPTRRIALYDLVMGVVDQLTDTIKTLPVDTATIEAIDARITDLRTATDPLLHLLIAGIHHDVDGTHIQLWVDVLQRLLDARYLATGSTPFAPLQHYPALLVLRTMSTVAVHRSRDDFLIHLLTTPQWADRFNGFPPASAAHILHMHKVLDGNTVNALPRWGGGSWLYPASHLLRTDLKGILVDYLGTEDRYRSVTDDVEYRTGLVQHLTYENAAGAYRPNPGEFVGEQSWTGGSESKPTAEVRFIEQIDRRGPGTWATLGNDSDWNPDTLDIYREILKSYRQWG